MQQRTECKRRTRSGHRVCYTRKLCQNLPLNCLSSSTLVTVLIFRSPEKDLDAGDTLPGPLSPTFMVTAFTVPSLKVYIRFATHLRTASTMAFICTFKHINTAQKCTSANQKIPGPKKWLSNEKVNPLPTPTVALISNSHTEICNFSD